MPVVVAAVWALAQDEPRTFVAVVVDVSPTASPGTRCDDVRAIAARAVAASVGELRVALFATGDRSTANEPVLAWKGGLDGTKHALEGAADDDVRRSGFIDDVVAACTALKGRNESPIFHGLQTAVAAVMAEGCDRPETHCRVFVRTDGIEEADGVVVKALRGSPTSAPRVDNAFVDVEFCGLGSRTVGKKTKTPDAEHVAAAFRAELTAPSRVRFSPSCSAFAAP